MKTKTEKQAFKAALINHIKKLHLCTDEELISRISSLEDLCSDLSISDEHLMASKRELESFSISEGIGFSCFGDEDYPHSFYHLENPPSIIYHYGDLELINRNFNLAIVGTRNSSLYGEHCCRSAVEALEDYDVTIVSGLARGIDLNAHKTALQTNKISIAVLGSGLLRFDYSGQQQVYFEELKKRGLVISEFHPEQNANGFQFATRNRLIAALSNCTLVIEAPRHSGALITAKHCLELHRELYAIPGDLNKRSFEGSNQLLTERKASAIFQTSMMPKVLGLECLEKEKSIDVGRLKKTIEKKVLRRNTPTKKKVKRERLSNKTSNSLIELLDSGINDFDLLLFKSQHQSGTELIKELTDLEIQGKIARRGALFMTN